MKAITVTGKNKLSLAEFPVPEQASPGHIIIKMLACGINSGDKLFIAGAFPRGIPASKYDIAGVSGAGTVVATGKEVPGAYLGKNVAIYRSLKSSGDTVGTWSEYSHIHYLNSAILPGTVNAEEYSGSLVNTITPYAFLKHAIQEGHKGIICTAGNSATGIAMLGICLTYNFPLILLVRNENAANELNALGAKNVLVRNHSNFKERLKELSGELNTTAVFDGVGGMLLTDIIDTLPFNSTVYSYGFLDNQSPFSFSTSVLMRGITIRGFSNFRTQTVLNAEKLELALNDISRFIHLPHFRTKAGKKFRFDEVTDALLYSSGEGKAVLYN